MQDANIINSAKELVKITIEKHKENLLGKEKMSSFIKRQLPNKITKKDYDSILHLYSKYLAKEGYEIKDVIYFDIIDYTCEYYKTYYEKNKKL